MPSTHPFSHAASLLKYEGRLEQIIYIRSDESIGQIEDALGGTYWRQDEVKTEIDVLHWKTLMTEGMKKMTVNSLTEFLLFDVAVMNVLGTGFASEIKNVQLETVYATIASYEALHSVTYSNLSIALIGKAMLEELMNEKNYSVNLKKKIDWYVAKMTPNYKEAGSLEHIKDHAKRVVANCATEGLFFSSKFCAIYWLKRKGLMPGLAYANEVISRDEGLHCTIGAVYYKKLGSPLSAEEVIEIVVEAAELEIAGVLESHPDDLEGLSPASLCDYVRSNCNFILTLILGTSTRYYDVDCPYPWMDSISIRSQTSFFERVTSDYNSAIIHREIVVMDEF